MFVTEMRISLVLILNVIPVIVSKQRDLLANTTFGTLKGLADDNVQFNGEYKSGVHFLGIPFGKPPTGERRFSRPLPETPLEGLYDATFFRPHCPQSERANQYIKFFNTSEDCLYLNVFVPGNAVDKENSIPVMIWIYGGLFAHGGADIYSGDILSAFNDVIVVTFNYRVNIFGFLDDGSGTFANNGLHDQKLAIDWVRSHIQSFGGDPDNMTLFGESAGGVSVIYQTMNNANRGKFKRVIAQSGSPLASYAFQSSPRTLFDDVSSRLDCNNSTSTEKLECLRNKTMSEIVSKLNVMDPFLPSIDGEFLTADPKVLLSQGNPNARDVIQSLSEVDFMTGVNNKDGGSLVLNYWSSFINTGVTKYLFDKFGVPLILRHVFGSKSNSNTALTQATIHQYTDWSDLENKQKFRDNIVDLATDLFFLVPAIGMANKHAASTKPGHTYLYQFSHKPWIMKKPEWIDGALHAWEIPYVFGLTDSLKIPAGIHPDVIIERPAQDSELSMAMMKYWTNFARTGNPNSPDLEAPSLPIWTEYESTTQTYIDFTVNMTSESVKRHLAASRVRFWTDVAPLLQTQCSKGQRVACDDSLQSNMKVKTNGSPVNFPSISAFMLITLTGLIVR